MTFCLFIQIDFLWDRKMDELRVCQICNQPFDLRDRNRLPKLLPCNYEISFFGEEMMVWTCLTCVLLFSKVESIADASSAWWISWEALRTSSVPLTRLDTRSASRIYPTLDTSWITSNPTREPITLDTGVRLIQLQEAGRVLCQCLLFPHLICLLTQLQTLRLMSEAVEGTVHLPTLAGTSLNSRAPVITRLLAPAATCIPLFPEATTLHLSDQTCHLTTTRAREELGK